MAERHQRCLTRNISLKRSRKVLTLQNKCGLFSLITIDNRNARLGHIEGEIMFVGVLTHDSTARSRHVLYKQSAISEGKLDSNQNPGSLIKSYNHNLYIKRNFEMSIF